MKKPSSMVAFLITFLLAAVVCTHGKERETVKDTDGNPLSTDHQYFIQPIKTDSNSGGGLVPAALNILPFCPLGITQTLLPNQPGLPVRIIYPRLNSKFLVETSLDVNIVFESGIWPVCNEFSKFWEVDDSSSAAKEPAILIGGEREEHNSWFKIEKAMEGTRESIYKLTTSTGTVGAIPGPWLSAPQLVVTNDPAKTLFVTFKKVERATTATTSTSRLDKLRLRMFPFY